MVKRADESGEYSKSKGFRFSQALISDMVAYLSKRQGREVSMEEADEALGRLTDYFQILIEHRKDIH